MNAFFKALYINLFTANLPYSNSQDYRRLVMVNVCLYLSSITLLLFAFFHTYVFDYGKAQVALIDIIGAFATGYAIYDLRRSSNVDRAALLGTISLIVFFLTFFHINQNESFGLIWSVFFPIFAITVNGARLGLQITVVFYLILFGMAYNALGVWQDGQWDLAGLLRLIIASSILTIIIYLNEVAVANAKQQEQQARDELKHLSCMDELTQIANRREINNILRNEILRAQRYRHKLSLILFDIDDFKLINDQYGHLAGDSVLQEITCIIKNNIRNTDSVGRWGGEEFCLILPEEKLDSALVLCEKIRAAIESHDFESIHENITCSFGVAECNGRANCADQLIHNADSALYQAKSEGKNTIITYNPEKPFAFEQKQLSL